MTKFGNIPPMSTLPENFASQTPGLVAALTYDGLCTFEFGIAVEVFGLARPEFEFPWYKFKVVASEHRRVSAMGGITVEADAGLEALKEARTIIIPGWRDRTERPPEQLIKAIREASQRGARCISICSGVFVLAAAGLLDGRRATTHWRHIPCLKQLYPEIQIEEDVLYVDEGNVITSAGSAAGIDACLYLIRKDYGSKVANDVARRLVTPPHRDGGQTQFVSTPVQVRPGKTVGLAMDWARERLSEQIKLADMAACVHKSERTFLRRFRETVGITPMVWLQRERMFKAQEMLEVSNASLADVASQCGYQSLETFRVSFKRVVGTSPAAYRSRFQSGQAGNRGKAHLG